MATESRILGQFDLPPCVQGNNYKAKCRHCGALISGSTKTCSNFTTHLKVSSLIFTKIKSCELLPFCLEKTPRGSK